jgi:hypothetical protein
MASERPPRRILNTHTHTEAGRPHHLHSGNSTMDLLHTRTHPHLPLHKPPHLPTPIPCLPSPYPLTLPPPRLPPGRRRELRLAEEGAAVACVLSLVLVIFRWTKKNQYQQATPNEGAQNKYIYSFKEFVQGETHKGLYMLCDGGYQSCASCNAGTNMLRLTNLCASVSEWGL